MSKLTELELRSIYSKAFSEKSSEGIVTASVAALRAIESAATEPLLQRIAELERQLEESRKDAERWSTFLSTRPQSTHEVIIQAIDDAAMRRKANYEHH